MESHHPVAFSPMLEALEMLQKYGPWTDAEGNNSKQQEHTVRSSFCLLFAQHPLHSLPRLVK